MGRAERIELRVSPEEKARIAARAGEAGLGVSEWLRLLALGKAVVSVSVTDSLGAPAAGRVERVEVDADHVDLVLESGSPPKRHRCPMGGCDFSAPSPAARCPVHGRTVS